MTDFDTDCLQSIYSQAESEDKKPNRNERGNKSRHDGRQMQQPAGITNRPMYFGSSDDCCTLWESATSRLRYMFTVNEYEYEYTYYVGDHLWF